MIKLFHIALLKSTPALWLQLSNRKVSIHLFKISGVSVQNPIFCYDTFSNVYMYAPFYTHPLSKTQLKVIFFQVSILDNSLSFDLLLDCWIYEKFWPQHFRAWCIKLWLAKACRKKQGSETALIHKAGNTDNNYKQNNNHPPKTKPSSLSPPNPHLLKCLVWDISPLWNCDRTRTGG